MVLKFALYIINVTLLLFCIQSPSFGVSLEKKSRTIVIDAGHGGKDPGAVRGSVYEKTINLAIALELGRRLTDVMPEWKIIYTRTDDRFVELAERTNIANRSDADLFVSIHTNSNPRSTIRGTETYVMGVDKNRGNLAVSMRENGVISLEPDYRSRYEGYDPTSSESLIIFSLMQYAYQNQSLALACSVERAYAEAGLTSRGVHQAGFLVLWRTAMPSILTEVGFLSSSGDLAELTSTKGPKKIAGALTTAIKTYVSQNLSTPQSVKTPSASHVDPPEAALGSLPIVFSVQIKSSAQPIAINSMNFGPLVMKIKEIKTKNFYKYCVEELISYKEALLLQNRLRAIYPDAFLVAFCDGKQISVKEAKQKTEQ
ncbi:MAG: N-acetylmuramoyl-L-alanine amidase [Mucinivorans sp.]